MIGGAYNHINHQTLVNTQLFYRRPAALKHSSLGKDRKEEVAGGSVRRPAGSPMMKN